MARKTDTALVAEYLRKLGEAIHHIGFEVDDLESIFGKLRIQGIELLSDRIIEGSRNSKSPFSDQNSMQCRSK